MAAPLRKQSVNMASGEVRVSRIRRDPPPPKAKEISLQERDERNRRDAVIGVVAVTFALLAIVYVVSSYNGWSLRQYVVEVRE